MLRFLGLNADELRQCIAIGEEESPRFSAVVLTSKRAAFYLESVVAACDRCENPGLVEGKPVPWQIWNLPCFVVGPKTAQKAAQIGFWDVRGAECGSASDLADKIIGWYSENIGRGPSLAVHGLPVLFLAAEEPMPTLPTKMTKAGVALHQLAVYRTIADEVPDATLRLLQTLVDPPPAGGEAAAVGWLSFFSLSGVRMYPKLVDGCPQLARWKVAAIGKTTADAIAQNRTVPSTGSALLTRCDAIAKHPNAAMLLECIVDYDAEISS